MKVILNSKGTHRWLRGHPWIFRGDLEKIEDPAAGAADVVSPQGKLLGQALYSPKSLIALRKMTRGRDKINADLINDRILRAKNLRDKLYPRSSLYRLVFGEADFLPSLIIDRYHDVLVFQTLSAGMEVYKEEIVQFLQEIFSPRSLIERNDSSVRQKEELPLISQVKLGEAPSEVLLNIEGKKIGFNPLEGQKTGFFLDQRFNALRAAPYAHGRVLDAFAHTGQFTVHLAKNASEVECVDSSQEAIRQLQLNLQHNGITNAKCFCENVFDFLKNQDSGGEKYNTVILDPPAFVKGRQHLENALRGYKEINLRAMRLLKPEGILVTFSCSQLLTTQNFEEILADAAQDAGRTVRILEKLTQPPDHPVLLTMPESNYLKGYILRVD